MLACMLLNAEGEGMPWKVEHMLLTSGGGLVNLYELPHEQDLLEEYIPWSKHPYKLALLLNGVGDMMLMEALLYLKDLEEGNPLMEDCRWTCMQG